MSLLVLILFLLILSLLVLILFLLIFLLLLILSLLRLFLSLLLHFFQFFDLLFESLGFPTIGKKNGLIFCDSGMIFCFAHGFPVHFFCLFHYFQGRIDLFLSLIQILLLKSLE